jgi:hypothetical protein
MIAEPGQYAPEIGNHYVGRLGKRDFKGEIANELYLVSTMIRGGDSSCDLNYIVRFDGNNPARSQLTG